MSKNELEIGRAGEEFAGAELGDPRRTARLVWLAEKMAASPAAGFPAMAPKESDLEGLYRFLRNPHFEPVAVLAPHFAAAGQRAADSGPLVLVAHDTSEFECPYEDQQDVGYLQRGRRGFLGHFSLAVRPGEARVPLGLLAMHTWAREGIRPPKKDRQGRKRKMSGAEYAALENKESERWGTQVEAAESRLPEAVSAIHVMDREADSYELLAGLVARSRRFVVRLCKERNVFGPESEDQHVRKLRQVLGDAVPLLSREVPLSRRRQKTAPRTTHQGRSARTAQLRCAATRVSLRRPRYLKDLPAYITLNVVRVYEVGCPQGHEPVEWVLLTTEPVDSAEQLAFVIDAYRSRWIIEEYFKAIKTGCGFSKRQLESRRTLEVALAVSAVVAWQLLLLRAHSRENPDAPAATVLTPGQLRALTALSEAPLPPGATVKMATLVVARLGGHLRSNGPPGWQSLARGLTKLLNYAAGYQEATNEILDTLAQLGVLDQPGVADALRARLKDCVADVGATPTIDG